MLTLKGRKEGRTNYAQWSTVWVLTSPPQRVTRAGLNGNGVQFKGFNHWCDCIIFYLLGPPLQTVRRGLFVNVWEWVFAVIGECKWSISFSSAPQKMLSSTDFHAAPFRSTAAAEYVTRYKARSTGPGWVCPLITNKNSRFIISVLFPDLLCLILVH